MQNSKKQITEKARRSDLLTYIIIIAVVCLYAGLRTGYFMAINPEGTIITGLVDFVTKFSDKPWMMFPTNPVCILLWLVAGALVDLVMYNKYLIYKDTVENAHGDAHFEEDYDQYEREFVADPKIISQMKHIKMTDRKCPRNEEGKKVYKKINPSDKKWHDVMEECRRQSMVYTDKIYLSLNGSWCQRNTNSVVFGASGTGKSRYFLKPNILQANGSFICTDPSGDIMQETGYFLEHIKGYKIKCFNISDMTKSCRFNPLHYIRDTKDIPIVAQTFLENMKGEGANKGGDGDFWDKAAQALLCCTIGYLFEVCPEEQRNLSNVLELIRMDRHEEGEEPGTLSPFDTIFQNLGIANPTSYAYQQYNTYTQAPVKTRNNILISTSVNLQQLDIPEVRNLTYKDEMELDMLGEVPMAIFLNIPQADSTYGWLTAMLYSLLFKRLYVYGETRMKQSALDEAAGKKDENGKKIKALSNPEMKIPVRFLIDECANVGKIPNLEKYLATCRKYRISIVPIFQNYSQIVEVYGKEKANNIVSNCDAFLFLGGADKDTLEIIQSHLGKETVKTLSHSMTRSSKGSNSSNKQQTGKDLMTRDQIETMSNAECLLFIRALRPFNTKKYDLNRHPNYKYLSEGNEGRAYPNPFGLEYEDENIENIRLKAFGEEGYIAPIIVDSARRRNLIATNRKKAASLEIEINSAEEKMKAETDANKKAKMQTLIAQYKEELRKLKMTDPEYCAEMKAKQDAEKAKMMESDESKAPDTGANTSAKEPMEMNGDVSHVIGVDDISSYACKYEFDEDDSFDISRFTEEETTDDALPDEGEVIPDEATDSEFPDEGEPVD